MTESTPGPWRLILHGNEEYPFPLSVHTADGSCWVVRGGEVARLADARLVAAAPELLASLKMAQLWLDADGRFDMQGINAAIAKAEST